MLKSLYLFVASILCGFSWIFRYVGRSFILHDVSVYYSLEHFEFICLSVVLNRKIDVNLHIQNKTNIYIVIV